MTFAKSTTLRERLLDVFICHILPPILFVLWPLCFVAGFYCLTDAYAGGCILNASRPQITAAPIGGVPDDPEFHDVDHKNSILKWQLLDTSDPTPDVSAVKTNVGIIGIGGATPTFFVGSNTMHSYYYFIGGDVIYIIGTNDYLRGTPICGDLSKDFSIAIWIRSDSASSGDKYFFSHSSTSSLVPRLHFYVRVSSDQKIWFVPRSDNNQNANTTSLARQRQSVWEFFVGTWDASTKAATLYRNAVFQAATTNAAMTTATFDSGVVGRSFGTTVHFQGGIARPMIYTNVLAGTNITTMFRAMSTNWGTAVYDMNDGLADWSNTVIASYFEYQEPADTSFIGTNDGVEGAGAAAPTYRSDSTNGYVELQNGDTITYVTGDPKSTYMWWGSTNLTEGWNHYAEIGPTQYVDGALGSFDNVWFATFGNTNLIGTNKVIYIDDFVISSVHETGVVISNRYAGTPH